MSLTLNMVGGCGGGLSGSAYIQVKALTGSTVTFSNSSGVVLKTLTAEDGVLYGENPLLSFYYYAVPNSKFGLINVLAELDGDSYTKTVTVNSKDLYYIDMKMRLYLFRDGNECTGITGGWSADGWIDDRNAAVYPGYNAGTYLYCAGQPASPWGCGGLATINKIQLNGFSEIHYYGYKIKQASSTNVVCVQTSGAAPSKLLNRSTMAAVFDSSGTGELDSGVDISSVDGSYYIVFAVGSSPNCQARANEIYLV